MTELERAAIEDMRTRWRDNPAMPAWQRLVFDNICDLALAAQQGPEIKGLEAAWSQFINCRNDPSGDKAEDEAEEQRNVLALSAAIQALAPPVVAEPTPPEAYKSILAFIDDIRQRAPFGQHEGRGPSYRTLILHSADIERLIDRLLDAAMLVEKASRTPPPSARGPGRALERIRQPTIATNTTTHSRPFFSYFDASSLPKPPMEVRMPDTPSPHKGEPDVLRDAVAILKRLSILRIPPYDLPADSFLEKAATEIITLVIAAPPPMEGIVLVPEATPNHPEPGADHDRD